MPGAPSFHLIWSPTWPEESGTHRSDFQAKDPAHRHASCRIYKATSAATLGWFWMATDGNRDLGHGYEPTARKAAVKAEDVYFADRGSASR